jgi:hypothetical protein
LVSQILLPALQSLFGIYRKLNSVGLLCPLVTHPYTVLPNHICHKIKEKCVDVGISEHSSKGVVGLAFVYISQGSSTGEGVAV